MKNRIYETTIIVTFIGNIIQVYSTPIYLNFMYDKRFMWVIEGLILREEIIFVIILTDTLFIIPNVINFPYFQYFVESCHYRFSIFVLLKIKIKLFYGIYC